MGNELIQNQKLEMPQHDFASYLETPNVPAIGKQLIFGVGTGRCGMRWLNRLFNVHANCHGGCERFRDFESFYRYACWNKFPIDFEGFYKLIEKSIYSDWLQGNISFLSSPFFDFGLERIANRFQPTDIIFSLREPEKVINSLYVKGWYQQAPITNDAEKCLGPQPINSSWIHHSFGRIAPTSHDLREWLPLTAIGKITWFYAVSNLAIYESLKRIGGVKKWFVKLEDIDQNYDYYQFLANSFKLEPLLTKEDFLSLKGSMDNQLSVKRSSSDWSYDEKKEFERIIAPFMEIWDSIQTTGL